MKKIALLLIVATLAGCVSENPDGRTALEAIAEGDKIAENTIDAPEFIFALAVQGPHAVELLESMEDYGVTTAPFDFQMDIRGDALLEGRAKSWLIMYEDQFTGEALLVHVGSESGSKKLTMDDGHGHTHLLDVLQEDAPCPTSPDFKTDSPAVLEMVQADDEFLGFLNASTPDTYSYLLYSEGACFSAEISHRVGLHADEKFVEAWGLVMDGNESVNFIVESPPAQILIDQFDSFQAPPGAIIEDIEYLVSFEVPREGVMSLGIAVTEHVTLDPLAEVHIYLLSPSGESTGITTYSNGVMAHGALYDVSPGTWSVVYQSTNRQPLATLEVQTTASM